MIEQDARIPAELWAAPHDHFPWEVVITMRLNQTVWQDEAGQDIAEYAVMLAVILLLVVGTIRLIGTNANSTFSNVASNLSDGG